MQESYAVPTARADSENVLAGVVGAFLFSLSGGIIWFLLYQVGFLAGISGIIGVICAIKGYALFAKKESVKGVVIASVMALLVIVLAWYLCLSFDVYKAYQDGYVTGEVDFTLTFFESVRGAYLFLEEGEIAAAYIKDLLIGIACCAIGVFSQIRTALQRVKQESAPMPTPAAPAVQTAEALEAEWDEEDETETV